MPEAALEAIDGGTFDAFLSAEQIKNDRDGAEGALQQEQLRDAARKAEAAQAEAREVGRLEREINAGGAGMAAVTDAFAAGRIGETARDALCRQAAEKAAEDAEKIDRIETVARRLAGDGPPLDPAAPDDIAAGDLYYDETVLPALGEQDPTARAETIGNAVVQLGVMPEGAKSFLTQTLRADEAPLRLASAEAIDRVTRERPDLAAGLDPDDVAFAQEVTEARREGVPDAVANGNAERTANEEHDEFSVGRDVTGVTSFSEFDLDAQEPAVEFTNALPEAGAPVGFDSGADDTPLTDAEQRELLDELDITAVLLAEGDVPLPGDDPEGTVFGRVFDTAFNALLSAFEEPIGPSRESLGALVAQTPEEATGLMGAIRTFNEIVVGSGLTLLDAAERATLGTSAAAIASLGQTAQEFGASDADSRRLMRDAWILLAVSGLKTSRATALPPGVGRLPLAGRAPPNLTAADAPVLAAGLIEQAKASGTLGAILRRFPEAERAVVTQRLQEAAERTFARRLESFGETEVSQPLLPSHRPANPILAQRYDNSKKRLRALQPPNLPGVKPSIFAEQSALEVYRTTNRIPGNPADNMTRGLASIDLSIRDALHGGAGAVPNAMYREGGMGPISFYWGLPGKGDKFKGGFGLSHIIAKHGIEVLPNMVHTIAEGKVRIKGTGPQQRAIITLKHGRVRETQVVLALMRHGNRETWVITSFDLGPKLLTDRPFNLGTLAGELFFR